MTSVCSSFKNFRLLCCLKEVRVLGIVCRVYGREGRSHPPCLSNNWKTFFWLKTVPYHLGDAEFLALDESLQHHTDGHADVVVSDDFSQMHPRVGLRHPDDALDVSDCDGQAPESKRYPVRLDSFLNWA